MATKQIQKQTQQQKAKQRLTPQQVLVGQMIEKPIDQLTEFVNQQMHENPALEESSDNSWETEPTPSVAEMAPAVDEHSYNDDDYLPVYTTGKTMEPSDMMSFYDKLKEQMMELELDERQRFIMEYLIGTLDSDGLLRKSLDAISDEMAIYHNFEATTEEIGEVLRCLQTFDPPGVGASDLREGARIEHMRFGVGTVVRIEGTGENTKATVEFTNAGTKQLLLKFAKFKVIG